MTTLTGIWQTAATDNPAPVDVIDVAVAALTRGQTEQPGLVHA